MEMISTPESFELVFLDPKTIRFDNQEDNLGFYDSDGNHYARVSLRRSFPLSAQNTYIMVRTPDLEHERGHELGMIKDINELDDASSQAVLLELKLHYLVPIIQRIHSIKEEFGFLYWSVETDRGDKEFVMRDSIISSTRQVSSQRWLVIDINQTRYEIRDLTALDKHSQDLLVKYLLL
jgi:hypothetical protein